MNEKFFIPSNSESEIIPQEITTGNLEKAECPNCGTEVILDDTLGECPFCKEDLKNDEEE